MRGGVFGVGVETHLCYTTAATATRTTTSSTAPTRATVIVKVFVSNSNNHKRGWGLFWLLGSGVWGLGFGFRATRDPDTS